MNRIYQGRVSRVEILKPGSKDDWQLLPDWPSVLWKQHELFQDAVNYYTLALASLGRGLSGNASREASAAFAWSSQVRENWRDGQRKALRYDGPHRRLAPWLGVDPSIANEGEAFERSATAIIRQNGATDKQRAAALLALLVEANASDLNQLAVNRLPWFCTAKGDLRATPRTVVAQQEAERIRQTQAIHATSLESLACAVQGLEPGRFVTQMPTETMAGDDARNEAVKQFRCAARRTPELAQHTESFLTHLTALGSGLQVPRLGRKPSGLYPHALVLRLWPSETTWNAFKAVTKALASKEAPTTTCDPIADARANDEPLFEYFSNRVLARSPVNTDRAAWFDFDLAAFIEAIKAPHRFFEDSQARAANARTLRARLHFIDPAAGWLTGAPLASTVKRLSKVSDDGAESEATFTFDGDPRIAKVRTLVSDVLGYLSEVEPGQSPSDRLEYSIRERTLRGWNQIREVWRQRAAKGSFTRAELWADAAEIQAMHRDDFGSAALFEKLTQPEFQAIWRDPPQDPDRHADDPLRAWRDYRDLCADLKDKERGIRFTPAHATASPRYFIFPKSGKSGTRHLRCATGDSRLAFTAGVITAGLRGNVVTPARLFYSAPRLRRDELRASGETDLENVHWIQPMMQALGLGEPAPQDIANCRVTLQPSKVKNRAEDEKRSSDQDPSYDIQLTFPIEIDATRLQTAIGSTHRWARQFNQHPDGERFYDASLRWPHEKQQAKAPVPWWETASQFSVLSVDLGQRDAGAFAILDIRANDDFQDRPYREIGTTGAAATLKRWRAGITAKGMFRLPGEDRRERRNSTRAEQRRGDAGFAWREELHGERGRTATNLETDECARLLSALGAEEADLMGPDWRSRYSFPEQNDKLLVAARRAQSRLARLHRWAWFLNDDKRQEIALKEISNPHVTAQPNDFEALLAAKTEKRDIQGTRAALEVEVRRITSILPSLLVRTANRILPVRQRVWNWAPHPDSEAGRSGFYLLSQSPAPEVKPLLRGQRGLSFERIEQIEELRRRFQSLNQSMRRKPGSPPLAQRDDAIPDPCPDLLEKLDRLKQQRVNQTAHMILAEALGVRLRDSDCDKTRLKQERDMHGQYRKVRQPVDFIAIEDLSRYRASQGRSPRENSRLMKWSHRAIRDKLIELCKPFGMTVVETPAAWSSQFCSRTGVRGFRAIELHSGMRDESPWSWLLKRWADFQRTAGQLSSADRAAKEKSLAEARHASELFAQLDRINKHINPDDSRPKWRTLYAPMNGGPIFIPLCDKVPLANGSALDPAIVQSDINAAINIGLRAVADPRLWSIHPRLRTERDGKGGLIAREKRKYGTKPARLDLPESAATRQDDGRQPNLFVDLSGCVSSKWSRATVPDPISGLPVELVYGGALWKTVQELQWSRVDAINRRRISQFEGKADDIPM